MRGLVSKTFAGLIFAALLMIGCASRRTHYVPRNLPPIDARPSLELVELHVLTGNTESARSVAARLLEQRPDSLSAHHAWVRASLAASGGWRLVSEYREVQASDDPCRQAIGAWALWQVEPDRRSEHESALVGTFEACGEEARLAYAMILDEQGKDQQVLTLMGERKDPQALLLRVRALVGLDLADQAERLFLEYVASGGTRPDVGIGLVERGAKKRMALPASSALLNLSLVASRSSDPEQVARAWKVLAASRRRNLAKLAADRLAEAEPGLLLPHRLPWGAPMIRSLSRALAASGGELGSVDLIPPEAAMVSRELLKIRKTNGDPDSIERAFSVALQWNPRSWSLRMERVGWLMDSGRMNAERSASSLLDLEQAHVLLDLDLATSRDPELLVEARARINDLQNRLIPFSPETGKELRKGNNNALNLHADGELWYRRGLSFSEQGHSEEALAAFATALASGYEPSRGELQSRYRGPASIDALIEAARSRLLKGSTLPSHLPLVEVSRETLLGSHPLSTHAGPLRLDALRGRVVVITFWASWCAPCQEEVPALAAVVNAARAQGMPVDLVALSVDRAEKDWRRGMARLGLEGDGLVFAWAPALALELQIQAIPSTWVLDPAGRVVGVHQGYDPDTTELIERQIREHAAHR